MSTMHKALVAGAVACLLGTGAAWAKLPTPQLTDEQKAAAEVAKARTAHAGKVAAFQNCKAMDRAADNFFKNHPQAAKPSNAPACADPGPFVAPVAAK